MFVDPQLIAFPDAPYNTMCRAFQLLHKTFQQHQRCHRLNQKQNGVSSENIRRQSKQYELLLHKEQIRTQYTRLQL